MRFITLDVYDAWYDRGEDQFLDAWVRYQAHLESLRGRLPDHVLELAEPYGLEDALIVRVRHDRVARKMTLVLRGGHLQMGYYDLELSYHEAQISPEHDAVLAQAARGTRGHRRFDADLCSHELDITKCGIIEHRLLFHSKAEGRVWLAIRCRSLDWLRVPKPSRRIPHLSDRYPDGPEPTVMTDP